MTVDLYRVVDSARTTQRIAWLKYERLANTPEATSDERRTALREALVSDQTVRDAVRDWSEANNLPG